MLVAEWKQVHAEMFQLLMESLPRRVEAVIAAKGEQLHINAHDFGMKFQQAGVHIFSKHQIESVLFSTEIISILLFPFET